MACGERCHLALLGLVEIRLCGAFCAGDTEPADAEGLLSTLRVMAGAWP
jgi:hypothetical protein